MVSAQKGVADDLLGERSQVAWIATSPWSKPMDEKRNGRDGPCSRRASPQLFEQLPPMWQREYKDYLPDSPLNHHQVEAGRGIVGCEMHELNGWGERFHQQATRKPTLFTLLFNKFLRNRR